MNKTVTINIAGLVFHIEEDAYERLRSYLDTLRMKFNAEEGRDEILADIESRIAEILTAKKGPAREVVLMTDIDEVIAVMGEPEAISDEANTQGEEKKEETREEYTRRKSRRRLFRDPDDKVVGGVCSGIGHYFDIDPVWLRLAFALTVILAGTGVLFYLLLMIIIPKAETTAEKLEMRGDPVDVNNIKRSIQEEFEEWGERVKNYGKRKKHEWGKADYDNRYRSRYHRRRGEAEDFLRTIGSLLGRFVAFCFVAFGIVLLIGLLIGAFSITDIGPDFVSYQAKNLFDDITSYYVALTAGLIVFGVPILMMIYSGVVILFRLKRNNKILGFSALGIWIVGIVMAAFSISNIASGFSEGSEISERIPVINAHRQQVNIRVNIDPDMVNDDYGHSWGRKYHYGRRWRMISTDSSTVKFGDPRLNIVPSTTDSIELIVYKKAQGRTIQEAQLRVQSIGYTIAQDSNTIIFPSAFSLGASPVWKAQEVEAELRIPVGTVIYIDPSCENLIYDIYNVSETNDYDMIDRRWKMTTAGLECVDCAGLEIPKHETQSQMIIDSASHDTMIITHPKIDTLHVPNH